MEDLYNIDKIKDFLIKEIKNKLDFTWIDNPETDKAVSVRDFLIENPKFIFDIFRK